MESPPAIGEADPVSVPSPVSAAPPRGALGKPTLLQSPVAQVRPTPCADVSFQTAVDGRYDGRALDLIAAVLTLLFVLPLMCLCALAVIGTSRGPLLYRQRRVGRDGELFDCLKFRTMVDDADGSMAQILQDSPEAKAQWQALHKLKHDPRVTPVGLFMRRYCLDELPQLFNVLAGEMSMVGPRPIVPAEQDRFGVNFGAYCSVKPGLTGIWQVSGRHRLSYDERVALDASYARSKCLSLDLLILWKTVPIVFLGQNE